MTVPAAHAGAGPACIAYIALGSNLHRPVAQLHRARDALSRLPDTRLLRMSPLYRNPALGHGPQPDYVNAVAAIETRLEAHDLLNALHTIEAVQGRVRGAQRWESRTLDLDLLMYGDRSIADDRLTVPHPRIKERAFVLKPLMDVAPELEIPGLGRVEDLLGRVSSESLQRIECPDG